MNTTYLSLLIFFLTTYSSTAQHLNVSGRVIGEDLEGFPGVSIYDEDTTLLTTSNLDGTFELSNSPTKLIFATVGAEWNNISVSESCSKLEVILLLASTYHYKSHRKIDRLRKEQFDNRVELHKRAFEQGIFKNDSPCFDYVFVPDKAELDEIRDWMNQKKSEINQELKQLAEGDTIYVPYATSWRYDGTDRTALHQYSSYTDDTEFGCIIAGTLVSKDKKGNIRFSVIDIGECDYDAITLNERPVKVGDILECNMKYFRVITASNKRYE
jgi:hypothetical protein